MSFMVLEVWSFVFGNVMEKLWVIVLKEFVRTLAVVLVGAVSFCELGNDTLV